ncbi:MAG TPA: glycerol-3-phosphate 1-O-acyltransferase PlsY [Gemmataceae bacterium]|nr:glycerol-3-phosphate 1-O-acyltransferase PlsY [Gemmataceae bacterium]
MTAWIAAPLIVLVAYLIGAIPFGYLIARARGVDIFQAGSGNIGATNVGRVLGRRFGILVFLLDFAKGAVPVAVVTALVARYDLGLSVDVAGVLAGLTAFLGHLFPVYLRFRGGKGVATGAGVIVVLLPGPAAVALLTWVAVVCASRYVSVASIAAVLALCVARLMITSPFAPEHLALTIFCVLAAALIIVKHRGNIGRLRQGNENRMRESSTLLTAMKVVHLLSLGLWFGVIVFFTFFVGLSLFDSFETVGTQTDRPAWFPLPSQYQKQDDAISGPKEQGTRAAGYAISPMFGPYYLLQGACGLLALGTAVGWMWHASRKIHRVRALLLLLALATVVLAWPLEQKVNALRIPRNEAMDRYLQSTGPRAEQLRAEALAARAQFGMWHGLSLLLNFVTLGLVGVALAQAAFLPSIEPMSPDSSDSAGGHHSASFAPQPSPVPSLTPDA